jgi:hypothetical protein
MQLQIKVFHVRHSSRSSTDGSILTTVLVPGNFERHEACENDH